MNLDDIEVENESQTILVYGPPKSGKTYTIVKALAQVRKVLYIDLERGVTTLRQLPKELRKRVEVIKIPDTKDSPYAIDTCVKLLSGKKYTVCEEHGRIKCPNCLTKASKVKTSWELNTLDPTEWVVVVDSFTQLTSSAQAHVCRNLDLEKQRIEFDHYRAQWILLEKFLDFFQNARFHCCVITHETGIELEDGTEKIMPSGGTKNFARGVSKYAGHIVYFSVTNRKHKAISSTTAAPKVLAGSRLGVEVDINDLTTFHQLLGIGLPVEQEGTDDSKSKGNVSAPNLGTKAKLSALSKLKSNHVKSN